MAAIQPIKKTDSGSKEVRPICPGCGRQMPKAKVLSKEKLSKMRESLEKTKQRELKLQAQIAQAEKAAGTTK